MKCSLVISNFLEAIASLSHSIVFLYFFALIAEEGFLISPCYSLNSAFKWVYLNGNIWKLQMGSFSLPFFSQASGPITSWQMDGETVETMADFIFLGSKITADGDCSHEIKRRLLLGRKVMTNLDSNIKKQRHYFVNKGPSSQGYCFSSGGVWMWELDYKESWVPKDWCFWTVVLEKTLESPLDC